MIDESDNVGWIYSMNIQITPQKRCTFLLFTFLLFNMQTLEADICPNNIVNYMGKKEVMLNTIQTQFREILGRNINEKVLKALRNVSRHEFVRCSDLQRAYGDHPLPIGAGQTISQPFIVALMTDLLDVQKNHKILEIGTGSGYQAAVLGHLATHVHTIEIIEQLGNAARNRLQRLGLQNISVYVQDGYHGLRDQAPFDSIIVTAAATHLPAPLLEQLKVGGKIIIPVGPPYQTQVLKLIKKNGPKPKDYSITNILTVRFVPFTRSSEQRP